MATYGVIFEDAYHCLRCASHTEGLTRYTFPLEVRGQSVDGFAYLCRQCLKDARRLKLRSLNDLMPLGRHIEISDSSPYCEVMDHEFWELFRRPGWQTLKLVETGVTEQGGVLYGEKTGLETP